MSFSSHPFLSRSINKILSQGGVSAVSVVDHVKGNAFEESGLPNIQTVPRAIICLKGQGFYEYTLNGARSEHSLSQNEAIFIPAGSWLRVCGRTDYDSLGIVFFDDITRILFVRANDAVRKHPKYPFNLNREVLIWPRPLTAEGQAFLAACSSKNEAVNPSLRRVALFNLVLEAVAEVLREEITEPTGGRSRVSWQAACAFIHDHLHLPFGREDVADFLKLHPNHISRLFNQFSSCSFAHYVTSKRILRAKSMLRNPRWNVTDIALQCGFTSLSYFSRVFHTEVGLSPTDYRIQALTIERKEPPSTNAPI